jgi:YD repeat-containing protein
MLVTRRVVLLSSVFVSLSSGSLLAQPVLDNESSSMTSYLPSSKTTFQQARPRADQRGVDIDGTLRGAVSYGWAVAADSIGGGSTAGQKLGDVRLATGTYNPTDIDMMLPSLGVPVIIGRTYNAMQEYGGSRYDANSVQGFNWSQLAMPEIVTDGADMVYIVYGADRYIEFKRTGEGSSTFKAKNGAAGVIKYTSTKDNPDIYEYTDQRGTVTTFWGFDSLSGTAGGQFWKSVDAAGKTTYCGHATTASTALSAGYSSGRILDLYDGSGRNYHFTYGTSSGFTRLQQVQAKVYDGSAWNTVATVDYTYYDSSASAGHGLAGDLKLVTLTTPVAGSSAQVMNKYYRYYTNSGYVNSDGSRGTQHMVKLVVGYEGVRRYGASNLDSATDAQLKEYSDAFIEYNSALKAYKVFFNGECGCGGGGTNGVYEIDPYETNGSYSDGSGYTTTWMRRTIVKQPDGKYMTQYFDEVGQSLGRVLTAGAPATAPGNTWASQLVRDSNGRVTEMWTPAATGSYTHSTGAFTANTSTDGMVTAYGRVSSGDLAGLRNSVSITSNKTGASSSQISGLTMSARTMTVGASGVTIADVTASSSYPTTTAETTYIWTTWWSGTASSPLYITPKIVQSEAPAVTTGKNGPNTTTSTYTYFRQDGSVAFTKDQSDVLSYSKRDAFGRTISSIADANTSTSGDYNSSDCGGDAPSTWSLTTSGTAIHAKSEMTYDDQSRLTTASRPGVNGTITSTMKYATTSDGRLATFAFPRTVSTTLYGPASLSIVNHAGKSELSATVGFSGGSTTSTPSTTIDTTWWKNITSTIYDPPGAKVLESRSYTDASSFPGSAGTNYLATVYGYDEMGRRWRVVAPTGTISRTVFDERGLAIESWIGTCDSSFTGGSSGTDNMTKVESRQYDGGSAGGNGYLTTRTQDPTGSAPRTSTMQYDFRGRLIVQTNPLPPHSITKYDNLNRPLAAGQYSTTSGKSISTDPTSDATGRMDLSETFYDERGKVYKTVRWEITQSTGATSGSVTTLNWYDADGHLVKSKGAQITKKEYDRLHRATASYLIGKTTDSDSGYTSAMSVSSNDKVLEESHTGYHPTSGRALLQHSVMRHYDDTSGTGKLDSNADSDLLKVTITNLAGRAQISATWYDDWDRPTHMASLGTNGSSSNGETYDRGAASSPPSRSDTCLVTSYTYDAWGRTSDVTDVNSVVTHTDFDNLSRKTAVWENYASGGSGYGTNHDQNRKTSYVYNSAGLTESLTRNMESSSDDQKTVYTYGTSKGGGGSDIATGHLLASVTYRVSASSTNVNDRTRSMKYNAFSQVMSTTDPAGNVIETTYDTRGRVTKREAITIADGFNDRVKLIRSEYNDRGQMTRGYQQDGSSATLDDLTFAYDGWGNLRQMDQDPDGSMGVGGRAQFTTTWVWAKNTTSGGWQNMKLTSSDQPWTGSKTVTPSYISGSLDEAVGRASYVSDPDSSVLADYWYMGASTVVKTDQPGTNMSMKTADASGDYKPYLDNFGRVVKNTWQKDLSGSVKPKPVEFDVTYNRYGQPLTVKDNPLGTGSGSTTRNWDDVQAFDSLRRMLSRYSGEMTSGSITTAAHAELYTRNLAGKITCDKVDLTGNTTYTDGPPGALDGGEMDDARSYNTFNELTGRSVFDYDTATGSTPTVRRSVGLLYDANGNLLHDGERYAYEYNPWCQLVGVYYYVSTASTNYYRGIQLARYTYNALGQRISEQTDNNNEDNQGFPDDSLDAYDSIYYIATDLQGRRVATYRGTDTYPKEVFFHHAASVRGPGFAGGPIRRDRNKDLMTNPEQWVTIAAPSVRTQPHYYVSDFRGNVVLLLEDGGQIAEQYRYSPSGVPFGIPRGDVNGDGKCEGTNTTGKDWQQIDAMKSVYHVRADLNLDGVIDAADLTLAEAWDGGELGRTKQTLPSLANRLGDYKGEYDSFNLKYQQGYFYNRTLAIVMNSTVQTRAGCIEHSYIDRNPSVDCWSNVRIATADLSKQPKPVDDPPPLSLKPEIDAAEPCASVISAALSDPLLVFMMQQLGEWCGNRSVTIRTDACSTGVGSAETGCNIITGSVTVSICRNTDGTCPTADQLIDILLHELTHARQICREGCLYHKLVARYNCGGQMLIEKEAYCNERGLGRQCYCAEGILPPGVGNITERCRCAATVCQAVLTSLSGSSCTSPDSSGIAPGYRYCMESFGCAAK